MMFLFAIAGMFTLTGMSLSSLIVILFFIGIGYLFLMTAIGILKRQKWSKKSSTIIFMLICLSSFLSLFQLHNHENVNAAYRQGEVFGSVLGFVSSGVCLNAMSQNQSVKDYFSRS